MKSPHPMTCASQNKHFPLESLDPNFSLMLAPKTNGLEQRVKAQTVGTQGQFWLSGSIPTINTTFLIPLHNQGNLWVLCEFMEKAEWKGSIHISIQTWPGLGKEWKGFYVLPFLQLNWTGTWAETGNFHPLDLSELRFPAFFPTTAFERPSLRSWEKTNFIKPRDLLKVIHLTSSILTSLKVQFFLTHLFLSWSLSTFKNTDMLNQAIKLFKLIC